MVCSARAWAPTVCALSVWSSPISPASCVRRVRACAPHCCEKTYLMRSLLASPEKAKNIVYIVQTTTRTIQHPLIAGCVMEDSALLWRGSARVGRYSLRPRLCPGQLPFSSTLSLLIDQDIFDEKKYRHLECVVGRWMAAGMQFVGLLSHRHNACCRSWSST